MGTSVLKFVDLLNESFNFGCSCNLGIESKGLVVEFHDICPSLWVDICRFSDMSCFMGEEELYSHIINPFQPI